MHEGNDMSIMITLKNLPQKARNQEGDTRGAGGGSLRRGWGEIVSHPLGRRSRATR